MPAMQFRTVNSPLGPLTLAGKDGRLMHLVMSTRPMSRVMAVGSATTRRSQTQSSSSKSTSLASAEHSTSISI
jgi:hypothetical protein